MQPSSSPNCSAPMRRVTHSAKISVMPQHWTARESMPEPSRQITRRGGALEGPPDPHHGPGSSRPPAIHACARPRARIYSLLMITGKLRDSSDSQGSAPQPASTASRGPLQGPQPASAGRAQPAPAGRATAMATAPRPLSAQHSQAVDLMVSELWAWIPCAIHTIDNISSYGYHVPCSYLSGMGTMCNRNGLRPCEGPCERRVRPLRPSEERRYND